PIIAMTVTLAAVYAPIGLQGGLTGALFREFALTLAGAVFISGIVALTLSPNHIGANEYLGELYLLLEQPELAKERLIILKHICPKPCAAHDDLEAAIKAFGAAN
nr:efflux RND transporter permease subunit [Gammaproteobacteria bacterium]